MGQIMARHVINTSNSSMDVFVFVTEMMKRLSSPVDLQWGDETLTEIKETFHLLNRLINNQKLITTTKTRAYSVR